MAETKQMTMTVEDEKFVVKARRLSQGVGGIRYSVSLWRQFDENDWRSRVLVRLDELNDDSDMADQALWLAIEKGMAKWLKERP